MAATCLPQHHHRKPKELKNRLITDAYNQKKAQELAKIAGIIGTYLEERKPYPDPGKQKEELNAKKEAFKDLEKSMYSNDGFIPDKPNDHYLVQLREFFNNCGKKINIGKNKLLSGDIKGGFGT